MRRLIYRSFIEQKLGITRRGYYNDPPAGGAGGSGGNDGGAGGTGGAGGGQGGGANDDTPKFTQKQLNDLLAKERKTAEEAAAKKRVKELEEWQQRAGTSEDERNKLQARIDELEKSYLSKEEIAKREAEKKNKEFGDKLTAAEKKALEWENQFKKHLVNSLITAAGAENGAYSIEQMLTQLSGLAKVVPVVVDGKETGDYTVVVQFPDKNKEGQNVVLELTPADTMKRMKELPERYGNLFKSGVNGGVGGNNQGLGGNGPVDLQAAVKDPATYRAQRKDLISKSGNS